MADDPKPDPEPTPDDLGDAGKKALDAERKRARDAEKALKAAETKAQELETRLQKLEADAMSEQEKAIAKARDEAAAEARKEERAKSDALIRKSEVRAAAAGKLNDPEDAVLYLNLDDFEVKEDGTVDGEAISKSIETLLESKPYLAGKRKPSGDIDGGVKGGGTGETADELFGRTITEQLGRS